MSNPTVLRPAALKSLWRTYGARGGRRRAIHELRRMMGWYRSSPRDRLPDSRGAPLFALDADLIAGGTALAEARERADRVVAGQYQAFRWDWRQLPGSPAQWSVHPVTGERLDAVPWYSIATYRKGTGDIKELWEPARFGWAYDLARGFMVTGDRRYLGTFFENLEMWCSGNAPFRGPHWACGQETTIRAVALLFAEAAFGGAPAVSEERRDLLAQLLFRSGERVSDAIGYGLSQRNNHGISEATGLILLGARFAGHSPVADGWYHRGVGLLEESIEDQFASDGWYAQHSFYYLRLALEMCTLAQRVLISRGQGLSPTAQQSLKASAALLVSVMDTATGIVPNHGANDGSYVLPLSLAAYRDFRPVLTAVAATFGTALPPSVRPDREVLAWLGESGVAVGQELSDGVSAGQSGWASVRVGSVQAFLRAGTPRHRPGHMDQLQLDLRIGGREVLVDPGTFAYNGPDPWRNGLAVARVHNGPVLEGDEPGVRGPGFLWYIWPAAELKKVEWDGEAATLIAENGDALVRQLVVRADSVEITDRASGDGPVVVRWLLAPGTEPGILEIDGQARSVSATPGKVDGWFSPTYGVLEPAWLVEARPRKGSGYLRTRIEVGRAEHAGEQPAG